MFEEGAERQLNFAIIDGSAGCRSVLCAFLLTEWPSACIEEVDPFDQTRPGMGHALAVRTDVILLGGIGTFAEACAALKRLDALDNCPPVILMVARELAPQAALLIKAGASSILFKDGFSKNSLTATIRRLLGPRSTVAPATTTEASVAMATPDTQNFGQFSFIANGQFQTLEIERFRFVATLASSPLAQVFSAEGIEDRKRAIVKVALSTPHHNKEAYVFSKRFQFIDSLKGRNVVRYLDAGIASLWPYAVIEYLPGGDLRRRMAAGLVPREAVQVLHQLAGALAVLHAGKLAHMDVKPENIFFRGDEIVLIDFNISTSFGQVARNSTTGDVLGSPFYMSPEQGQGMTVDGRSDLYSLGVIFYEMLTGSQPYVGESAIQVIYKHIHDEIPLLPKRVRALQPILDGLMAKDRNERIACAEDLVTHLSPFLPSPNDTNSSAVPTADEYANEAVNIASLPPK